MGISIGGLVSGMDTDKIITQLQDLQKKPILQLQQKEADYQVKLSAYSILQGNLKSVKNAAKNLDSIYDIKSYSATSSNTGLLTASVQNSAAPGSYSVTVHGLAKVHKLTSSSFYPTAAVGKGTIHLSLGSNAPVDISIDDTSTISDVAKAINDAETGIYASVINDGTNSFLTLAGKQTGETNVIKLTVTEDGTSDPKLAANLDSTGLSRLVYTTSATSYKGAIGGSGAVNGLTIDGFSVTASVDMAELVANINNDVSGVTATLQTDGSLLLSNITGNDLIIGGVTTNSGLKVGTYSGTKNLTQLQAAANSKISVDGVEQISRATNTITDVLSGMTLNLKDADPLKPLTVTVERSDDLFTTQLNAFLDAYNGLVDSLKNLQSYDPQTQRTGMLFGDSTTRRIQSEIQRLFSSAVPGLPATLSHMTDLGVTTNEEGKLELDAGVFNAKLKDNYDDVVKFFTKTDTGAEGFGVRMAKSLENILDTTIGTLASRTKGIESSIDDLDDQITRLNKRLAISETRLRAQFSALEAMLGKYQGLSDSLTQQLSAIQNTNDAIAKG